VPEPSYDFAGEGYRRSLGVSSGGQRRTARGDRRLVLPVSLANAARQPAEVAGVSKAAATRSSRSWRCLLLSQRLLNLAAE